MIEKLKELLSSSTETEVLEFKEAKNQFNKYKLGRTPGEKASYIKQRGFKDNHYKEMILEYIRQYNQASKKDITNLISDILPGVLNKDQRANKVRNLIYSMSKRDKSIINTGTTRNPIWKLSSSN